MTKFNQCPQTSVLSHTSGLDAVESLVSDQSRRKLCKWPRRLPIADFSSAAYFGAQQSLCCGGEWHSLHSNVLLLLKLKIYASGSLFQNL